MRALLYESSRMLMKARGCNFVILKQARDPRSPRYATLTCINPPAGTFRLPLEQDTRPCVRLAPYPAPPKREVSRLCLWSSPGDMPCNGGDTDHVAGRVPGRRRGGPDDS